MNHSRIKKFYNIPNLIYFMLFMHWLEDFISRDFRIQLST